MKILITGINGQIGYSMISQVKMLGYEAIPIDWRSKLLEKELNRF